jgi:hypothetical protein
VYRLDGDGGAEEVKGARYDEAASAMAWAGADGLIAGRTVATLAPKGEATRAEAAAILQRFAENVME